MAHQRPRGSHEGSSGLQLYLLNPPTTAFLFIWFLNVTDKEFLVFETHLRGERKKASGLLLELFRGVETGKAKLCGKHGWSLEPLYTTGLFGAVDT